MSKYETARAHELQQQLAECTDDKNYSTTDCYRALDLELAADEQLSLPDGERGTLGTFGHEILVEKATGLWVGTYPYISNGKTLRELRVKVGKTTFGFELGVAAECRDSTYRILKNNPQFIFLVDTCSAARYPENRHNLIFYDKKSQSAFAFTRTTQPLHPEPTLEWDAGIYRFRWNYIIADEDKRKVREYFDFRVDRLSRVQCIRKWTDDCEIGPLDKRVLRNN